MKWQLSRIWNRIAFALIELGGRMVWDQANCNADLVDDLKVNQDAKAILCNK